jgi:hypothetical protein
MFFASIIVVKFARRKTKRPASALFCGKITKKSDSDLKTPPFFSLTFANNYFLSRNNKHFPFFCGLEEKDYLCADIIETAKFSDFAMVEALCTNRRVRNGARLHMQGITVK